MGVTRQSVPAWRWIVTAVAATGWVAISAGLVLLLVDDTNLRKHGQVATASILRLKEGGRNPDYADIRFRTDDGSIVTTEIEIESGKLVPGDLNHIEIAYDEANPTDATPAHIDSVSYWLNAAPLFVISAIGAWIVALIAGVRFGKPSRDANTAALGARMRVRRPHAWSSSLWSFNVILDGKPVGHVRSGNTFETLIAPGQHELAFRLGRSTSTSATFTVKPNATVEFEARPRSTHGGPLARGAPACSPARWSAGTVWRRLTR